MSMTADRARAAFAEMRRTWPAAEIRALRELPAAELAAVCELVLELGVVPVDSETLYPIGGPRFVDDELDAGDSRRTRERDNVLDIGATSKPARPRELDEILHRLGSPHAQQLELTPTKGDA